MKWKTCLWLIVIIAAVARARVPGAVLTENTTQETTNNASSNNSQPAYFIKENLFNGTQQNGRNHLKEGDGTSLGEGVKADLDESGAGSGEDETKPECEEIDCNENGSQDETDSGDSETTPDINLTEETFESVERKDLIVETTTGSVLGFPWSKEIIAYLDIPYGKFASDFEEPTNADSWSELFSATEHSHRCPQLDRDGSYIGDTDCLTLSVFIPATANNAGVLFYIHESDFTSGSGDPSVYGPEYLVPRNVILVLPNYRLGPLGFLCLRNDTIPGNAGLKDLALALSWIVDNIAAFGGDPSNIAVGGDGTSAALAGYLALSPMSKQFVTKVISDSGSVLSHWAIDRDPTLTATKVFESIEDNINLEGERFAFNNVDREILLKSAKDIKIRPCIEIEGFLTKTPWKILQEEKFDNITFMIGSANHAGLIKALHHNEASISEVTENFATMLPNDLVFANDNDRDYIGDRLKRQYFKDGNITADHTEELSLYYTDASYLGPSVRVARLLVAAGATVFLYEFSFVGYLNRELQSVGGEPSHGAVRGDIAGYLFTLDGRLPDILTDADSPERRMVRKMVDLWVSFIQNGEPTHGDIVWQPVDYTTEHWLEIGEPTSSQNSEIHVERLELWTDIYRDHFVDSFPNLALGLAPGNVFIASVIVFLFNFFK